METESKFQQTISFTELIGILWRSRVFIVGCTTIITLTALIYTIFATPIFFATTTIMPPQQQSATTAMLSALGGSSIGAGGGTGGVGAALGLKNPNDIYVAMFNSQRIRSAIISNFGLQHYYKQKYKTNTLEIFANATTIKAGKDGLISIQVEDKDPNLAARLANAYVAELRILTQDLAISEASQRRKYYEQQLRFVKDSLAHAEGDFRLFQERSGIVDADAQSRGTADAMAKLRANVAAKEIEIKTLSQFATANNSELQQANATLLALKAQLLNLTRGTGDNVWIAMGKAPGLAQEYARKTRNVRYFETLFEITAKQYEIARMDEAKDGMIIQVIDTAQPPELKSKPRRAQIVGVSLVSGWVISSLMSLIAAPLLQRKRENKLLSRGEKQ